MPALVCRQETTRAGRRLTVSAHLVGGASATPTFECSDCLSGFMIESRRVSRKVAGRVAQKNVGLADSHQ